MTRTRIIALAAVVILIAYGMWRYPNLPNEPRPTHIEEMTHQLDADAAKVDRSTDDLAASTAALKHATDAAERIRKEGQKYP